MRQNSVTPLFILQKNVRIKIVEDWEIYALKLFCDIQDDI